MIKTLLNERPNLLKEWHPTKNSFTPDDVSYGSQKKAWWICINGHEWEAMVRNRSAGTGCPKCAIGISEKYCLESSSPHLLKEWDYNRNTVNPSHICPKSEKKVWWICDKDHSWEESVKRRAHNYGCPYCSGKRACFDNCVATLRPDLLNEWDKDNEITLYDVVCGSNKKLWWVCYKGHKWEASVYDRTSGRGCPYCSGNKVCFDNCLMTRLPNIAAEWAKCNVLAPYEVGIGSKKKVWWVCCNGHAWKATVNNRSSGFGCPRCSKRISKPAEKWLDTLNISKNNREIYLKINSKRFYVDAYVEGNKTVYEFYGDYWHGNPKIYKSSDVNRRCNKTFGELYEKTVQKEKIIRSANYNIICIWESDFKHGNNSRK